MLFPRRLALFGTLMLLFFSCSERKVTDFQRGIYYWKNTQAKLDATEIEILGRIRPAKTYVRFFDVALDATYGAAPVAKTSLRFNGGMEFYEDGVLVPVVYIENAVFKKVTGEAEIAKLADNVSFLVGKYLGERFPRLLPGKEVQVDCDWTPSTRKSYFSFLEKLKQISGVKISCTLRLYPFKYPEKMGVPPVDKVSLMCYNLLSPLDHPRRNSILDLDELEAYLANAKKYPIDPDIILPAYSWIQLYHNKQFVTTMNTGVETLLPNLSKTGDLWYDATRDFYVDNVFVKEGDRMKVEAVSVSKAAEALRLLDEYLDLPASTTVSLYHLDSKQLTHLSDEDIKKFYSIR